MNPFLTELTKRPLLMDGAMGTMLYAKGVSSEECLEYLVISKPEWITEIHTAYATAGADVLLTHTFGANRSRLEAYGLADRVRDLNFRAVKLLRDVREVAGRAIFIAGDIGPLGKQLAPRGPITPEQATEIFSEQILALWEAGADLLHMETFSDLAELEVAVRAAKAVCDLPIVASMSYGQDGLTHGGQTPEEVVVSLQALGVDVIGANCSVGPASLQQTMDKLHLAAGDLPLSVKPNAGFPTRVEGRFYYPSSPEYFGETAQGFLNSGARLLGGCCGTTPMHLRAMRQSLDAFKQNSDGTARSWAQVAEPLPEMWVSGGTDIPTDDEERPTGLLQKLEAGKFVISVEVDPPRSFTAQKQIEGARHAKSMGADAINVADSPMARVRMGALALCTMIQQQVDIETILHFTTRDRSLMGLQADLIGAHAIGVRNILALTGDPPSLGDSKNSTAVYDVDSIGLVRIIEKFNQGYDQAGKQMGRKGSFTIAVACDPTRPDLAEEVDRFQRKVSGGAHFTMTQPIYDPQLWLDFLKLYEARHGPFPVPVLIGVLPLQSHKHASFLHHEVPGITLSEDALERMRLAGAEGRNEGVKMAQELLLELKTLPHVQGVYLMPSFGRYEVACQVLEVLTPEERGLVAV